MSRYNDYAPAVLIDLGNDLGRAIPSGRFLGVKGDDQHTYGYHRGRAECPPGDYSTQLAKDQKGPARACAAVDLGLNAEWMRKISARMMAACKAKDPRTYPLREWFGTLDGRTVTGWDVARGRKTTADNSHLWHMHFSIHRMYVEDARAAAALYSLITGEKLEDWDMPSIDEIRKVVREEVLRAVYETDDVVSAPPGAPDVASNPGWKGSSVFARVLKDTYDLPKWRGEVEAEQAAQRALLERIAVKVGA